MLSNILGFLRILSIQNKTLNYPEELNKNVLRFNKNSVTAFLIYIHDLYYNLIITLCTPVCRAMPREIAGVTVFTANIITYSRGLLTPVIVACMKYQYLHIAACLIMFHDFLDHLDGVVARQQAQDGLSKNDDDKYGAFIDAQMDKLVFCTCLWSFLVLLDYPSFSSLNTEEGWYSIPLMIIIMLTSICLFMLEATIAVVRTGDYFHVKYASASTKGTPALRAVSEGKLKQKFESLGIAIYCLSLPNPMHKVHRVLVGSTCLWFAIYFSIQSLKHKLRARMTNKID